VLLRRTFAILLAAAVLVVLLGFLLPRTMTVERSVLIDRSPEDIFAVLKDLRHFPRWAPWLETLSSDDYRFEGPEQGIGATLVWSDQAGGGRLWITDTVAPSAVDLQMELGETQTASYFRIQTVDGGAQQVTWGLRIEAGTFDLVGRYMSLILPGLVGPEYERGLARLAEYLDRLSGTDANLEPNSSS
jgi:hypothetical protein